MRLSSWVPRALAQPNLETTSSRPVVPGEFQDVGTTTTLSACGWLLLQPAHQTIGSTHVCSGAETILFVPVSIVNIAPSD